MLIAVGLLCCIGSAIVGAAVQPLDIPKPFRCIKGQKCPIPWPRCPLGQATGRPCRPGYPRCKRGYTCIVGRCCKDRVPGKCPAGSLMGPVCGIRKSCKFGYTCRRGRCCSNQCPGGLAVAPFCNKNQPCKRGYICRKGVCCRKKIIVVPPGKCPFGQTRVPGSCISKRGCPKGSSCYKNTCCRRHIILPPGLGQCPPLPPRTAGVCAELCNNCESRGQLCCSNGCGHVCKDPVKPIVPPRRCPLGQMQVPGICISKRGCPIGSSCYKGMCCRRHIILPPDLPPGKCPFGQTRVPGICISKLGCPKGSSCYKNTCCRRHIILPPGLGQCPPLPPRTAGICVELCNNCESRGQLCCSNGCGHVCKDPVKPIVPPGKCPLGQIRVPGSCISKMGCPKGSSCYKNTCCRRHIIIPPGRDGFCPGGAAPPKFPICPLLRPKLPSLSCTSDKQCRKTEKCCTDYCGRRRCRTALPFPPP